MMLQMIKNEGKRFGVSCPAAGEQHGCLMTAVRLKAVPAEAPLHCSTDRDGGGGGGGGGGRRETATAKHPFSLHGISLRHRSEFKVIILLKSCYFLLNHRQK